MGMTNERAPGSTGGSLRSPVSTLGMRPFFGQLLYVGVAEDSAPIDDESAPIVLNRSADVT